jgi:hypothetical protein
MVKCGVLFEVRTESLNIIKTSFGFKGLITPSSHSPGYHSSTCCCYCCGGVTLCACGTRPLTGPFTDLLTVFLLLQYCLLYKRVNRSVDSKNQCIREFPVSRTCRNFQFGFPGSASLCLLLLYNVLKVSTSLQNMIMGNNACIIF